MKNFQEAGINEEEYTANFKKTGYYKQPWKLIYKILSPDSTKEVVEGYVIPINGFGLWDAIFGYLAIKPDGNQVIGISWYDQKETPGLGANIAEAYWQDLFPGKLIFQESASGQTDFKTAPLGIVVVRGKVAEVLGSSPKSKSAVDGMAGATLTGNGVTDAYRDVLAPYRPFLIKIHSESEKRTSSESDGKDGKAPARSFARQRSGCEEGIATLCPTSKMSKWSAAASQHCHHCLRTYGKANI